MEFKMKDISIEYTELIASKADDTIKKSLVS